MVYTMMGLKRYIAIAALLALTLIIAACDDPLDDGDDDAEDIETPTTEVADDADDTEVVTDDAATDDAVTDDVATDDAATDDVATEDDAAVTDEDDAVTDDATPTTDDATTDDAVTDDTDDAVTDDTDDAVAEDDADAILDQAAERFAELETAKFELDGTGYIEVDEIGEVSLSNAEGEVERPDRARIDIDVDTAIADVPVTVVSFNGEVYIEDPVAGTTHTAPDDFQFNPAIMFDEDEGIPALIRSVENAELLDEDDEVDGRAAYKIYGVIEGDLIQRATAGTFPATDDVDFNVWIDRETYDVLKILAEDPTEETDSVWEMWIYDHNEPVEIDDPS
jgi:hypothetical protein